MSPLLCSLLSPSPLFSPTLHTLQPARYRLNAAVCVQLLSLGLLVSRGLDAGKRPELDPVMSDKKSIANNVIMDCSVLVPKAPTVRRTRDARRRQGGVGLS